jgi:hypothetical protein
LIFLRIFEVEKRVSESYEAKRFREVKKRWKSFDAGLNISFGNKKAMELMERTKTFYFDDERKEFDNFSVTN